MAKETTTGTYDKEFSRIHGDATVKDGNVEITSPTPEVQIMSIQERVEHLDEVINSASKQIDRNGAIKTKAETERTAIDPESAYGVLSNK